MLSVGFGGWVAEMEGVADPVGRFLGEAFDVFDLGRRVVESVKGLRDFWRVGMSGRSFLSFCFQRSRSHSAVGCF